MGPTASGKSDLALRLVNDLPCEIISVDSAMVYRGMDIGTAKPSNEILKRIPHRLIDICDPVDPYSAARFREDAIREMIKVNSAGKIPLLVGGTMLYFRTLQYGISELPAADPVLRLELEAKAERFGWATLHARLAQVDAEAARRIHPNDPQRIQRALEIYYLTGRGMSEHFRARRNRVFPYRVIKAVVAPIRREELHRRIEKRFQLMLDKGFIDEVEQLFRRSDIHAELPAMRAVGYRQARAYLEGEYDYQTMVERAIVATRRLARRQLTWLRAEKDAQWLDAGSGDIYPQLLKLLTANTIRRNRVCYTRW